MKLVAFLLAFISVSYAFKDQCQEAYLKSVHEKCMLAHGGDRVVIEDLHAFKPANDKNGKCFRECAMRECKYFGVDNKFNPDVPTRLSWILHGGNKDHVKPIEEAAAKCLASHNYIDSNCDNAENFARCVITKSSVKLKFYNL